MEGKFANLVGAGPSVISDAPTIRADRGLACQGPCLDARASIVMKQFGADPNLPGPGQYVDPIKEGRHPDNGTVHLILSTQTNTARQIGFGTEGVNKVGRPLENLADGGEPNQILPEILDGADPTKEKPAYVKFSTGPARAEEVRDYKVPSPQEYEALSLQNAYISLSTTQILNAGKIPSLRPRSASSRRSRAPADPGPGAYIDPIKEGRDENGQVKPVSSAQRCPPSIGFTKSEMSKARNMAKPGAQYEPGPGMYINPMKEGRNERGEVKAVLSSQRNTPSATFGSRGRHLPRPRSAPASRTRRLTAEEDKSLIISAMGPQISSRYKSMSGSRWGPPGR